LTWLACQERHDDLEFAGRCANQQVGQITNLLEPSRSAGDSGRRRDDFRQAHRLIVSKSTGACLRYHDTVMFTVGPR